ncbi:MAG: thioredoxin domain-containing protein [Phycisphaerae bacterium]|nr:thioredoxin domain-containing protein [Phycisphaerae bacterium]
MRSLPLAFLAILIGLLASAALAAAALGLLPRGLPGCSAAAGCGALTSGPWGRVPGTPWPWSFVGVAWFAGLGTAIAWSAVSRSRPTTPAAAAARQVRGSAKNPAGISAKASATTLAKISAKASPPDASAVPARQTSLLTAAARAGAFASMGFLGLMVALGSFCVWCAVAHVASLVVWWFVEPSRQAKSAVNSVRVGGASVDSRTGLAALGGVTQGVVAGAAVAVAVSIMLGGLDARHRASIVREEARAIEAMAAVAREPTPAPSDSTKPSPAVVPSEPEASALPALSRDRLAGRHTLGSRDARIRVVLFTDYQCPDCARVEQQVEQALARPNVAVVVKHFPLCKDCNSGMPMSMHPDACRRAQLAEAAGQLGGDDAFTKAHRALFAVQPTATADPIEAVVKATGIDRAALTEAMARPEVIDAVKADVADAIALGVTFTPMVFVNGHEWKWYLVGGTLAQLVERVGSLADAPVAPPEAVAKLVDDWRVAPRIEALAAPTTLGRELVSSDGMPANAPEVRVWIDARLQGARVVDTALRQLIADGVPMRVRVFQFPATDQCNPGSGFKGGDGRSCLSSAAAVAAGMIGGDEAFRAMHAWLIAQGTNVDMAAILKEAADLKLDAARFQAAFSTGEALARVREEADVLNHATKATMVPTVVVNGRIIPRWSHPGAETAAIVRAVIERAARDSD